MEKHEAGNLPKFEKNYIDIVLGQFRLEVTTTTCTVRLVAET